MTSAVDPIRVMVVDDSAVIRGLLSRWLSEDAGITVVASAPNGEAALHQLAATQPEVVLLDIEMPKMDGMTALPKLLEMDPGLKVIMSSTLTAQNADVSLRALEMGAADYIPKPASTREMGEPSGFRHELVEKVKALASARRMRPRGSPRPVARVERDAVVAARPEGGLYGKAPITLRPAAKTVPKVIAIGSSTGGPQALNQLLRYIGGKVPQPILVAQHMPATFTRILAEHLRRAAGCACGEAVSGEPLLGGRIYIAPGDHHMLVAQAGGGPVIELNQGPPENFCRPAVDPLFRSLARTFGGQVLGIVLTGMGHDGLRGSQMLVEAGGTVIAQDEPSSVVWGMPGAVATGGLCSVVAPISELGPTVLRLSSGGGL